MTYLSLKQTQLQLQTDLLATDLLPECPRCHELCPVGATVCAECGTRLFVRNSNGPGRSDLDGTSAAGAERRTIPMVKDCTCGDAGVCTACVLAEYDRDPFAQDLERAVEVVTAPARALESVFAPRMSRASNVVDLHGHSKKVRP